MPQDKAAQAELAKALNIKPSEVRIRGEQLHETNPMMGHRGVRLGVTYPEVTEMQVRAIFEAAAELIQAGKDAQPGNHGPRHLRRPRAGGHQGDRRSRPRRSEGRNGRRGEVPLRHDDRDSAGRLLADRMAKAAQFFSFGTNDLTQMTFGFSRDDIGGFLPDYLKDNVLAADPFQTIDQEGVGQLIKMAVEQGRATRGDLKIGICGEQGGDPA